MRLAISLAGIVAIATPAWADTFNGFSGVDKPYLVNQDRVCTPLTVSAGRASGTPRCERAAADVIAKLSIKKPKIDRGDKAEYAATASGQTITLAKKAGDPLVAWDAPDPIGKVVEVYVSDYGDRVAVAYAVRRAGRDVVDVVAFDLIAGKPAGSTPPIPTPPTGDDTRSDGSAATGTQATPQDPRLAAAVKAARAAAKPKAVDAWKAVLALDPDHSEAHYQIAAAHAAATRSPEAIAELTILARSIRADAIDFLVEARFDAAFAAMRGDPAFRKLTKIDAKPATLYERLMGFGGQWEQAGTSCDAPEVRLVAKRDRTFKLNVKTACHGQTSDLPFGGTWKIDTGKVILTLPTRGKATKADDASCVFEPQGDEDALHCNLGHDVEFTALPTRR